MSNKGKRSGKGIIELVLVASRLFSVGANLSRLIGFEARLAGRSIVVIIALVVISAILLSVSWLGLLALVFLYLTSLHWSIALSLTVLLAVNVLLLIVSCITIAKAKKNLLFPLTCRQCLNYCKTNDRT